MSRCPMQQATAIRGGGPSPKRNLSLRSIGFVVPPAFAKLRFATPLNNKTRQLPGFFLWIRRDWLRRATPHNRPQPSRVGLPPKRSLSLRSICFVVPPAFAETAFRNAVEQQNPATAGLLFVVDPEGFEPSSSHGTMYAFYMLSFRFIVGKGKAGCVPVPFSVVALSHQPAATTGQPAAYFDAPNATLRNQA